MAIKFNGVEFQPKEVTSYSIEYWYDRKQKYWVVTVFDNNDCEVEHDDCPSQEWKNQAIESFKERYNTNDIKKV